MVRIVERIEKISKTRNKKPKDFQFSRKSKNGDRKAAEEKEVSLPNNTKDDSDSNLGSNIDVTG